MGETFPDAAPSVRPPETRLDSWKEIAAYLNRDVTTVQRWEKREGMPVHRHQHDRMGSAGWPSLPLALLHRGWPILRAFCEGWVAHCWHNRNSLFTARRPETKSVAKSSLGTGATTAPISRLYYWRVGRIDAGISERRPNQSKSAVTN